MGLNVAIPTEREWKAAQGTRLANRLAEIASILLASAIFVAAILLIESIRAG